MEATRAGTPPAPDRTATVAPFRAWRGLRLVVAEDRRGPPLNELDRIPPDRSDAGATGPWTGIAGCLNRFRCAPRPPPYSTAFAPRQTRFPGGLPPIAARYGTRSGPPTRYATPNQTPRGAPTLRNCSERQRIALASKLLPGAVKTFSLKVAKV